MEDLFVSFNARGEGDVIRQARPITLPRVAHSKRFSEATRTQFLPIVCNTNFWSRWKERKSLFSMHRELPILPYSEISTRGVVNGLCQSRVLMAQGESTFIFYELV